MHVLYISQADVALKFETVLFGYQKGTFTGYVFQFLISKAKKLEYLKHFTSSIQRSQKKIVPSVTLNVSPKTSEVVLDGIIDIVISSNVSSYARAKKITAIIKMSSPLLITS